MKNFFLKIFKGTLTACGVVFLGILMFLSWVFYQGSRPSVGLSPDSYLSVTISGGYNEYFEEDSLSRLFEPDLRSLHHLLKAIRLAKEDSHIKGLILRVDDNNLGMGKIQELRSAIKFFRTSGKPVYAFADTYGEGESHAKDFYLASAASSIWLQPLGEVNLVGLGVTLPFVRNFLDFIGVRAQIHRRKEFKSAPEMYTESTPTASHRAMWKSLLGSLSGVMVRDMAADRGMDPGQLEQLMAEGPFDDESALAHKLIDRIGSLDELRGEIQGTRTLEELRADRSPELTSISYQDYLEHFENDEKNEGPCIALLYLSGEIVRDSGDHGGDIASEGGHILSYRTANILRKIAKNGRVKAVVLRIDSPGGSVSASETIAQALRALKAAGKPVVISMGDMAASGGYWIAAMGDKIVAHPSTLTGSIGVYGGKFDMSQLSANLGVHWEAFASHENALASSAVKPYSERNLAYLNRSLDQTYQRFLEKVSTSRKLEVKDVERVARGRVWTGEQAFAHKLVDRLGGLDEAVEEAFLLAQLEKGCSLEVFPKAKKMSEILSEIFLGKPGGIEPVIRAAGRGILATVLNQIKLSVSVYQEPASLLSPVTSDMIR